MKTFLFFDTETTGLPKKMNAPYTDTDNWPRIVQLAWLITDEDGDTIKENDLIICPDGFDIPIVASNIHGITTKMAQRNGVEAYTALELIKDDIEYSDCVVCHNYDFDAPILGSEFFMQGMENILLKKPAHCTQKQTTDLLKIPSNGRRGYNDYKWPSLKELHNFCFGCDFKNAHNALADVEATKNCFLFLQKNYPHIFQTNYKNIWL